MSAGHVGMGLLLIGIGLAGFWAGSRMRDRWARGGGLLLVLTGFFVVLTLELSAADGCSPLSSVLIVLGAAGTFQLMTWFEPGPPTS